MNGPSYRPNKRPKAATSIKTTKTEQPSEQDHPPGNYVTDDTLLSVIASLDRREHPAPVLPTSPTDKVPADFGRIALTVTEARRLFQLFTNLLRNLPTALAARRMTFHLQWSTWRRRHQARARRHHYKRRLTDLD